MIRNTLIAMLLAVTLAGVATAALVPLEENFELGLNQVTLPAHSASQVVIRECGDCSPQVLAVNGSTVYFLGQNQSVSLAEMRAAAADVRDRESTGVYVFYKPETGVVTRIVLSLAR